MRTVLVLLLSIFFCSAASAELVFRIYLENTNQTHFKIRSKQSENKDGSGEVRMRPVPSLSTVGSYDFMSVDVLKGLAEPYIVNGQVVNPEGLIQELIQAGIGTNAYRSYNSDKKDNRYFVPVKVYYDGREVPYGDGELYFELQYAFSKEAVEFQSYDPVYVPGKVCGPTDSKKPENLIVPEDVLKLPPDPKHERSTALTCQFERQVKPLNEVYNIYDPRWRSSELDCRGWVDRAACGNDVWHGKSLKEKYDRLKQLTEGLVSGLGSDFETHACMAIKESVTLRPSLRTWTACSREVIESVDSSGKPTTKVNYAYGRQTAVGLFGIQKGTLGDMVKRKLRELSPRRKQLVWSILKRNGVLDQQIDAINRLPLNGVKCRKIDICKDALDKLYYALSQDVQLQAAFSAIILVEEKGLKLSRYHGQGTANDAKYERSIDRCRRCIRSRSSDQHECLSLVRSGIPYSEVSMTSGFDKPVVAQFYEDLERQEDSYQNKCKNSKAFEPGPCI